MSTELLEPPEQSIDPQGPGPKASLEQTIAEQANAAIAAGRDPKQVTDRLGVMVKHLRENPDVVALGNAALARGADPRLVASRTWDLASKGSGNITLGETPLPAGVTIDTPHPKAPTVQADASRVGAPPRSEGTPLPPDSWRPSGVAAAIARHAVFPAMDNPLSTVATMGGGVFTGVPLALQGAKRGVEYGAQKAAELTLPPDVRALAEKDPSRISGGEAAVNAAMLAAPLLHGGVRSALRGAPEVDPVTSSFGELAREMKGTPPVTESAAQANFIDRLQNGIPAANKAATGVIPKPEGFRPGLAPSVRPVPDEIIADKVGPHPVTKVAPKVSSVIEGLETSDPAESPSRPVRLLPGAESLSQEAARHAAYDKAVNDAAVEYDERQQEEVTRSAALRALTGVKRRPGGAVSVADEALPIERTDAPPASLPDVGARPEREPFYTPRVGTAPESSPVVPERGGAVEPAPNELRATGPRSGLPPDVAESRVPGEPFAMGGRESRIPQIPRGQRIVAPRAEPVEGLTRNAVDDGPAYKGPRALYDRLSNEALGAEYRAMIDKKTGQAESAVAPLWDAEREARAVEQVENRRRPDGSLAPADKQRLATLQMEQGEAYGTERHTFASASAEKLVKSYTRHIDAIEREMQVRGIDPAAMARPHDVSPLPFEEENPFPPSDVPQHAGRVPGVEPEIVPTPGRASFEPADLPHGEPTGEAITTNTEKFAPKFRGQVDEALVNSGAEREVVPIAQGMERVRTLAQEIGADPLSIDPNKVGRLSGEEIVAMRSAAQQHMAQIAEWSKQLADPNLPIEQRTQLDYLVREARQARDNLIEGVSRAASQKGRDLNFLKQMAQHSLDPDVWEAQAKALAGDRVLSDDVIAETRRLAKAAMEACGG